MNKIDILNISVLHSFPENPFKVKVDEELCSLSESIKEYGVITPIIVRKLKIGEYEVVAGHRRIKACEMAGIDKVPAIIRDMSKEEAVIALVDSNIQRENILPSERAFAYKMKLEAIRHQGKTSSQLATKLSLDEVGSHDNISGDTVWRYVRLTNLNAEILKLVDEKNIALSPAVALSYLTNAEQNAVYEMMIELDCTPSYAQSIKMKNLSGQGELDIESITKILSEIKPNQQEVYKFKRDEIRKFFPKNYSDKQIQETLLKLLEQWHKRRQRDRDSR